MTSITDNTPLSGHEQKGVGGNPPSFHSICGSFPEAPRVIPTLAVFLASMADWPTCVHLPESSAQSGTLPTTGVSQPDYRYCAQPLLECEEEFRHSGWRQNRRRVWDALITCHLNPGRLDRFRNCGSELTIERSAAGDEIRLRGSSCRDRFCTPCGIERAERIARNLAHHCQGRSLRFVTLTLRHRPCPLRDQITRLLRCWRSLRATSFWKSTVSGGAYVIEIKVSANTSLWHVHMHLILEARWCPVSRLRDLWHRITGDSFAVNMRTVDDQSRGIAYITKYVGKPLDGSVYADPEKLQEYVLACRGVRFCGTYGAWRGVQLEEVKAEVGEWRKLGTLAALLASVREGDAASIDLLEALRRRYYWLPRPNELRKDTS